MDDEDDDDEEDEDDEPPHFLHDLDFSSHALQSKVLLVEQVHGLVEEHEEDDEQDHPEEVVHEWLDLWCFFGNLAQLAFN